DAEDVGTIHSDVTKVRQMLFNLLSNASKFTDNGDIRVLARRESDERGEWVVFAVEDTGIGMSEEQQSRVFQPFSQADASTTRKYGGTGLGLAITRSFTEMLGGDISLRSTVGVGTTFTVRIPAEAALAVGESGPDATAPEGAAQPVEGAEAEHPLVLVIDDEPVACEMFTRMLTREGVRCRAALDGETGIKLARELQPDLILLDVLMPSVDGWTVLS